MTRADAGYGLAVLLREMCEKVGIYSFSDNQARAVAAGLRVARRDRRQPGTWQYDAWRRGAESAGDATTA